MHETGDQSLRVMVNRNLCNLSTSRCYISIGFAERIQRLCKWPPADPDGFYRLIYHRDAAHILRPGDFGSFESYGMRVLLPHRRILVLRSSCQTFWHLLCCLGTGPIQRGPRSILHADGHALAFFFPGIRGGKTTQPKGAC